MTLLNIHNLSHSYHRGGLLRRATSKSVLRDISMQLNEAECVGLIGASGSGKSTLARLLMGLEQPTAGRVVFIDEDVWRLRGTAATRFQRDVQMVFQDALSAFNPQRTVGWSIGEPLRYLTSMNRSQQTQRIIELLQSVNLRPEYAERLPHELSGGQLQRAAIARALAVEPKLVILDEALSNLDRLLQLEVLGLLARLHRQQGTTFLLITHDLSLVQHLCQRALLLVDGKIVEDRLVQPGIRFHHPVGQQFEKAVLPARPIRPMYEGLKTHAPEFLALQECSSVL